MSAVVGTPLLLIIGTDWRVSKIATGAPGSYALRRPSVKDGLNAGTGVGVGSCAWTENTPAIMTNTRANAAPKVSFFILLTPYLLIT